MGFIPGFKKGLNLGGWISQCPFKKEHQDSFITEEDFKKLSEMGVDHVRLPFDYNLFETEEGEELEYGIGYTDNAVAWGKKYGINVLLDLHRTFGYRFQEYVAGRAFFEKEELQERFYKLWNRISARYGKESHVAFGLLNEIVSADVSDSWNRIAQKAVEVIRKNSPDSFIMIGGTGYNSAYSVKNIFVPEDKKIVYEFHFYEPFIFTHQGAPWDDKMDNDFRTTYPLSGPEYGRQLGEKGHPDYKKRLFEMPEGVKGIEMLEPIVMEAVNAANAAGVYLYCGEYGVFHNADNHSRVKWYEDMNCIFTKHEISRAAWNYKSMGFGFVDERVKDVFDKLCELM